MPMSLETPAEFHPSVSAQRRALLEAAGEGVSHLLLESSAPGAQLRPQPDIKMRICLLLAVRSVSLAFAHLCF